MSKDHNKVSFDFLDYDISLLRTYRSREQLELGLAIGRTGHCLVGRSTFLGHLIKMYIINIS